MIRFVAAVLFTIVSSAATAQCVNDNVTRVTGKSDCIAIRSFGTPADGAAPQLVIFIHGDRTDGEATAYMIGLARDIEVPAGTVRVALMRPGYHDRDGNKSTGETYGGRDGYQPVAIDAVAAAIQALKAHHKPSRTVFVGHSGGAAYASIMIGRYPGIADAVLLLACPCNVERWRSGRDTWSRSLSPNSFAGGVSDKTRVLALTGANDTNTWGGLAEAYVNSLKPRGIAAEYRTVPGVYHDGVLLPAVVTPALAELLK